jgi:hypothetical protein
MMIRAMRVTLVAYGVIWIILGMMLLLAPEQLYASQPFFCAILGAGYIATSLFLISASIDPVRHISWVKFAVLWTLLSVVTQLYCVIKGYTTFNATAWSLIINAFFAVFFLGFYPWRPVRKKQN